MNNIGSKSIQQMSFEIENLKKEWLRNKKEQLPLELLSIHVYEVISDFKDEKEVEPFKLYIESKIKLDENVKNSTATLKEIVMLLVTSMVSLSTFILSFLVNGNTDLPLWISTGFSVCGLVAFIDIILIGVSIVKKHIGSYAREKTFYEVCLLALNKIIN